MKITSNNLVQLSIILVGLAVLYTILQQFSSFLRPFSIALLLTFLTINFFRLPLEGKLIKLSYVFITIALLGGLFYSLIAFNVVDDEGREELSSGLNEATTNETGPLNYKEIFSKSEISSFISYDTLTSVIKNLIQIALGSISTFISELFLVLLFWAFIIPSYDPTLKYLKDSYFKKNKKEFDLVMIEIENGIKSYLGIKTLISFGTAIVTAIILLIFGSSNVLLLTVLVFSLNFIPTIGSFIAVAIGIGLFIIQVGAITPVVILLAVLLILTQILFGNVIEPKVAGKGLNMSPLLVMFALLFWGYLWGVGGMLISVPLTHAIKTIIETLSKMNS